MGEILDLAESLWQGESDTYGHHPLSEPYGVDKVAERTWFVKHFANSIIRETDDGLVLIDPSGFFGGKIRFDIVRSVTPQRLHTAIYTHGHVDHCFGVQEYIEEAEAKNWPLPQVIAHEDMPKRFQRYRETNGYNAIINMRQFMGGEVKIDFPSVFHLPDIVYRDRLIIKVGGVEVVLRHARGETDDHTWVFYPDTKVLCTGDLFFWCVPNAGNPQKVQRYCHDWAVAFREMMALEPEVLLPGHGWPIMGSDRVKQALDESAIVLETIYGQTVELMNQGASLDQVIHTVGVPKHLLDRPYLHPVYDEPEFIVRNIWRLNAGWYDGTPSHLKPAPEKEQALEIARLAGGPENLVDRAQVLANDGNFRLACHLADWAYLAAGGDVDISRKTGEIYASRAAVETSTMAMGIYMATAKAMKEQGTEKVEEMTPESPSVVQAQDKRGQKKS
jgi:alkyl sulfatase BDS1-like metallo-beta-lactamase superfamily hydrolase